MHCYWGELTDDSVGNYIFERISSFLVVALDLWCRRRLGWVLRLLRCLPGKGSLLFLVFLLYSSVLGFLKLQCLPDCIKLETSGNP